MADLTDLKDKDYLFPHGDPDVVEATLVDCLEDYHCTSVYFYVVENKLQVACVLMSKSLIRSQQTGATVVPPIFKMRPN